MFFGLKIQASLINSLQKFQIIGKTRKIQILIKDALSLVLLHYNTV